MNLKLSDASRRLNASYQRVFNGVASGAIPAERDVSGSRWLIDEADLPAIAQTLGIVFVEQKVPAPASTGKGARRARAA